MGTLGINPIPYLQPSPGSKWKAGLSRVSGGTPFRSIGRGRSSRSRIVSANCVGRFGEI
jgi:hypothetical protein